MAHYITKASGEREIFSKKKFANSLRRAGASRVLAENLYQKIKRKPGLNTTYKIYKFALDELRKTNAPIAAHYNMKRAVMELGPDGYPFEKFIAALFRAQGYSAESSQILRGFCVTHEVDVVAEKDNRFLLIECKFHNRAGVKSNVKVPMYIHSRFEDIEKRMSKHKSHSHKKFEYWIVTNTKFTLDALNYGRCYNMNLLSWTHPRGNGLAKQINETEIHPITALTCLSPTQKKELIRRDVVLCRQLEDSHELLRKMGFSEKARNRIIYEAQKVMHLRK